MNTQKLIDAILDGIAARDYTAHDEAQLRAIDRYALDIIATYQTMKRNADIDAETRDTLERALLLGRKDWTDYAQAGYALYYPEAVAERTHAPASTQTEVDYLRKAFERIASAIAIPATNAA